MGSRLVPKSVTLNGTMALILHYFTEIDRLGGRLCHSGWKQTYKSQCSHILAKTDPHSSHMVSLRQLSLLFM